MDICVFLPVLEIGPPYKGSLAGTRRYAYSLIKSLGNQGIETHVVSTNKISPDNSLFVNDKIHLYQIPSRKEREEGYRKQRCSIKKDMKYFSKKSLEVWQKLKKDYKFNLIHTIDLSASSFLKAKRKDQLSVPIITSISNPIIARKIRKRLLKMSNRVIYTNQKSRKKAIERTEDIEEKSTIIHLSIDCKKYASIPKIEDIEEFRNKYDVMREKKTILLLGPYIPRKLQREIVDYFQEIIQRNSNTQFLICGEGPTLTDIKEKIMKNNLEKHTSITGYISDDELLIAYHISTVLLYPAESGSFGTPVIEAMASGLPIVAPDRAPMNEILTPENLYPTQNKEILVERITALLSKPEEREKISFESQKRAMKEYDYRTNGRKLAKIYKDVLS